MKEAWKTAPENKILVYLASDRPVGDTAERIDHLKSFMKILFLNLDVKMGSAKPTNKYPTTYKPIFLYLIVNLSPAQEQSLLSRRVWSTNIITFFTIPYDPPVSWYSMSLVGIQLTPPHEHEREVSETIGSTIKNNHLATTFIIGHRDKIEPIFDDNEAIQFILDSIYVRGEWLYIDKRRHPVFVYIHPLTAELSFHQTWLAILQKALYPTMYGVGQHHKTQWRCNICKGLDHLSAELAKYDKQD
jgi:hypothetical protein